MNERHSPGLNKRRIGRLLTRFRDDRGLTLSEAADALYLSRSALSRIERGATRLNVHLLKSMLDLYDIGGDRWPGLIEMAVYSREKGWWHEFGPGVTGTFIDYETEAEEIRSFALSLVHGLLQTADYARALIRQYYEGRRDIEDIIARHIAVRMARQERLTAGPPLRLKVVLGCSHWTAHTKDWRVRSASCGFRARWRSRTSSTISTRSTSSSWTTPSW